jgi:hypothetical protein
VPPHALAHIEAVLREKQSRTATVRKIDVRLLREAERRRGARVAAPRGRAAPAIRYAADGHTVVDVTASVTTELLALLEARGIEVLTMNRGRSALRVHIDIERLQELAEMPGVRLVRPQQDPIFTRQMQTPLQVALHGIGAARSEGDLAHLAHVTRKAFGVDGTGIKIGVLSNGVTNLAASQASGDLGPVTVVPGQAGAGDEGTALLEIVHDLAPGAQLFFATAAGGIANFADNIRTLRFTYRCDIIIDDAYYSEESPFHDGHPAPSLFDIAAVTQAVNDVTADGALYFASAGNNGNLTANTSTTWEGDFVDGGSDGDISPLPKRLHDFGNGQTYNVVTAAGNEITLHWSDPIGASANDYDVFLFDADFQPVDESTREQTGTQDPVERIETPQIPGDHIVIVKAEGAQNRFLHLSAAETGTLQVATAGAIKGHAGAANAIAVGATAADLAFPSAFNSTNAVERFSSDGPRRVFYQANGTPYTPGNFSATGGTLRPKPDLTAADGVRVTGVGGFASIFVGTSAAAPHAGAIAALVRAKNPALTPAEVQAALTTTAIDIGTVGADRDSGAGIVMADAALRAVSTPAAALSPVSIQAFDGPGDPALLNRRPEAGEGGVVTIDLGNFGSSTATGISAVITSSTPGITVRQQPASVYSNLPTSATGAANVSFHFTVASNFPCPQSASFTLNVNSNAGPQVFTFDLPIGPPGYQFNETLDLTAPTPQLGVSTVTGIQTQRLVRSGVPTACGTPPPPPTLFGENPPENTNRRFDAYIFNTCATSIPSCVTVTLDSSNELFTAAYAPTFNSSAVMQNYKGDAGASGGKRSYSFNIPGGSQGFAIDVHQVDGNFGFGDLYSVTVEGACGGTCAPPNGVPVAKAKNVTVTADATGFAHVPLSAINDGSFDPDGDPLTITIDNAGPYPIGSTGVLLTVTDTRGATSQATALITVTAQPTISVADVSVAEGDVGTVNAAFVITLSTTSTNQVSVSAATTPGTATAGVDFVHNTQPVVFLPGEVSKVFAVVVNGDITGEADETFTVNLSSPSGGPIADGQAIGTIANDDVVVTEAAVTQAVLNGALRLANLQRIDGGWYFRVGDTDCRVGAGVSCPNTVGITALGLLAGHTRTGDASLLTAAVAAGDYLVARYNATTTAVPPVMPASQDVEFLVELGAKTGNAVYTTAATNWFQRIVTNYTAQAYVDRLIAVRGVFAPIGVWNVGSLIRSAKAVANVPGNMAYAEAAALHVTSPAVEALWKDTDPSHRYDMCGRPGGCGLPSNPFGYDYTLVAMGTLLNAMHDIANPALSPKITEYQNHLLNSQDPAGSWDVGDTQITAYVVLGLASVGAPQPVIQSAVNWFLNYQLADGGWPAYATGLLQGAEYTELDAEAVRAIFTLFNTPQGEGVIVAPAQLSTLTFSEVAESGLTSVVAGDIPAGTTPSPGLEVLGNLAYDVSTTAIFNGLTTVCFGVPTVTSATDFADVRVLQQEGSTLVDRTILGSGAYAPNFQQRRVCGEVTSLDSFAIGKRDTTPPTATITLTPSILTANEKNIVSIAASITVNDNTDPSPTVTLVSVTSSEADKGLDKGDNPNDIHNVKAGIDDREFNVRAEAFNSEGRVYTATYRVADRYGNSRDVSATVTVLPNSRK